MKKCHKMSPTLVRQYQELSHLENGLEAALFRVGAQRKAFWDAARRESKSPNDAILHISPDNKEISWEK